MDTTAATEPTGNPPTSSAATTTPRPDLGACPKPSADAFTDEEREQIFAGEREVEADVKTAAAYGETVPDEFAMASYWHGEPVSTLAAFTGHLEEHRAALEPLLTFPERLIVCQAPVSAAEAATIQEELNTRLSAGGITSHGISVDGPVVEVYVLANRQDIAGDLVATYGAKVRVLLGAFPYPPPEPLPASWCPAPTAEAPSVDGISLRLDAASMSVGTAISPTVLLTATNSSNASIEIGDVREVEVLDAEGNLASVYVAGRTLEYRVNLAEPGGSATLQLDIPFASCNLANGYALQPGEYTMVAVTKVGTATAPLSVTP